MRGGAAMTTENRVARAAPRAFCLLLAASDAGQVILLRPDKECAAGAGVK